MQVGGFERAQYVPFYGRDVMLPVAGILGFFFGVLIALSCIILLGRLLSLGQGSGAGFGEHTLLL